MSITITYQFQRGEDLIDAECTGEFYNGELEDFTVVPFVQPSPDEDTQISEMLIEQYADDWDEDSYKGRGL